MKYPIIFCAVILITTAALADLPSLDTLNSGVFTQSLKNLPAEFDNIEEIIFVQRGGYEDPHWYANIGYYCDDENKPAYTTGAQIAWEIKHRDTRRCTRAGRVPGESWSNTACPWNFANCARKPKRVPRNASRKSIRKCPTRS